MFRHTAVMNSLAPLDQTQAPFGGCRDRKKRRVLAVIDDQATKESEKVPAEKVDPLVYSLKK